MQFVIGLLNRNLIVPLFRIYLDNITSVVYPDLHQNAGKYKIVDVLGYNGK